MLDHVRVEAYGEMQPLSALAQIALKNPTMLLVNPFDAAVRVGRWHAFFAAFAIRSVIPRHRLHHRAAGPGHR